MIIHIDISAFWPLAVALGYNTWLVVTGGAAGVGGVMPVYHTEDNPMPRPSEAIKVWGVVNTPALPRMLPSVLRSTAFTAALYLLVAHFTTSSAIYNLSVIAALISLIPIPSTIYLVLPHSFALLELNTRSPKPMTDEQEERVRHHLLRWNVWVEYLVFVHMASWLAGAGALVWLFVRWVCSWFW